MKMGFKKKIPVIITSLIQLVILLMGLIHPENIVANEQLEAFKSLVGFSIFILAIVFAIILWDEIKHTKIKLIAGNITLLIFAPNIIIKTVAVVNIIMLMFVKYEKKEKMTMKEMIPMLSMENSKWNIKKWAVLILLLVVYFGQNFIKSEWLEGLTLTGMIIFAVAVHVITFVLAIIPFYSEIKNGVKVIAKNFKTTINYMLKLFFMMIIIMAIATYASVTITNKTTSVNQESIESLPMYITIPLAVIWAPVVEESIFRGGIKKIIKNKFLFIILSGATFGFLHAIEEATLGIAIATSLPYAAIGMVLAYSYAKTNNLAVNMLFHLLYNALAVFASCLK